MHIFDQQRLWADGILDGEQWVRAELIVPGDSLVTHIINGDTVLQYSNPQIGGGVVNRYDPAIKQDGKLLSSGFIALQSEGHPVDFRNIELMDLCYLKKNSYEIFLFIDCNKSFICCLQQQSRPAC